MLIVDGDAELLRVVFGNLISNAIKYSPRWQRLALRCTVAGREVHVTVQDWGVGIPADEQDKLFTRFFRASTALGIPGSGMGLALVRELVQRHGGSIAVDSSEDEGTRFTVRLPLLPALDERH
ncbi:Sensor histidine kinase YycG [compost metagenome]